MYEIFLPLILSQFMVYLKAKLLALCQSGQAKTIYQTKATSILFNII